MKRRERTRSESRKTERDENMRLEEGAREGTRKIVE
jgi:hypothetical protein